MQTIMDKKTQLTKSIPGFMEDWRLYKNGLKGLKITDWCILSDYCFDDKSKEDALTFTIFPYNCVRHVLHEIEANIPCDIKKMTHIPDKCINFLKNSPYFFHIAIVVENLKDMVQEQELLEQLETTLCDYKKAEDLDKSSQDIKNRYKSLRESYEYIKQKSHSKKLLAQIFFVSQFVSQILEFLLIKENGRKPYWVSDRDHMATHCNGLLFFWVNFTLASLLRGRVTNYWLRFPAEIKENNKEYPYDPVIRVPDIITGILSSMKYTDRGIQMDKPKHYKLFQELVADNPRVITLEFIYQKNGRGYFQRVFWGKPIEGCQYEPFDPNNCKRFKNLAT